MSNQKQSLVRTKREAVKRDILADLDKSFNDDIIEGLFPSISDISESEYYDVLESFNIK